MKPAIVTCLSLSVFVLCALSCKKSDDSGGNNKFVGCHIVNVLDSSDAMGIKTNTVVSYDISGTMLAATTKGTITTTHSLDYTAPAIPILRISGSVTETDTISLDNNGKISAIAAHYYTSPWTNKISYFGYDVDGRLQIRRDYYSTGQADTFIYNWSNGDLLSEISRTDSFIYSYDTSMLSQDGDWLRVNQIITQGLGRTYITNKHVIASRRHNMNAPTYFFYLKDNEGRISTCNAYTGSSLEVFAYTYYCTQ